MLAGSEISAFVVVFKIIWVTEDGGTILYDWQAEAKLMRNVHTFEILETVRLTVGQDEGEQHLVMILDFHLSKKY